MNETNNYVKNRATEAYHWTLVYMLRQIFATNDTDRQAGQGSHLGTPSRKQGKPISLFLLFWCADYSVDIPETGTTVCTVVFFFFL